MRTFSRTIGMHAFDSETAVTVGRVVDFCIEEPGQIKGLLISGKGLWKRNKFLPFEHISSFGDTGVMICGNNLMSVQKEARGQVFFDHFHGVKGKMFLSEEGDKLGLLDDVYFDEKQGTIVGYEVTDGFFADITEGKKIIHYPSDLIIGKDAVVVTVTS
ncbi:MULTISPECIES: PRC-barrel domain-containing protein [Sutcliffiella]|uniref:PRC-barrel domain-containing protein n=1 Tax=Sutcliffiella cohnii TaxID=33932 RepID=A0A223KTJ9_9BACI|nr:MULTISPECIES: PRC-barrel domain-containing protein [Sutcliffiella]AST92687.1 hypothetical protein BC6307_16010 [Sutcliffiella cohnii]MED4016414.1 PRC-barrel domain-containing protein [Sutcliffiella cohnii]WBL13935.1 PRC-barrel domain-containing protein [Sutcliffiella sp. NC1]